MDDIDLKGNGETRLITVNDNTAVTTDKAVMSGVISHTGAGAVTLSKAGAGILELKGNNTFVGGITLTAGTLQFSTVSNNGGPASNLGQGSNGITLSGGVFSFVNTNAGVTGTIR